MKGRIHKVHYPLVYPFKLSYGTFYEREGLIVELSQDTRRGWGEMSFVPYYGKQEDVVMDQLHTLLLEIESLGPNWVPWEVYRHLHDRFAPDHFILSAVDCALYDLYGKMTGESVWKIAGGSQSVAALSSLTITQEDWEEKLDWGWPLLKLKMGFEGDIDLLRDIRLRYSGDLRIDANSGWTIEGFEDRVDSLVEHKVSLLEQPVPRNLDEDLMGRDYPFPLAADESVQGLNDLERVARVYQVANIKLQKCGGITPARDMINTAKALGLQLMAGCMTESSVGIGAMAHLASHFDYLDLDGEYLITPELGQMKYINHGVVELPDGPGLGQDFDVK
ncbi:MAG TPA: dipeptide epimerase [Membranihabitans sp.]|nr:dipeptide epimerase [Membranihabitans sp.]